MNRLAALTDGGNEAIPKEIILWVNLTQSRGRTPPPGMRSQLNVHQACNTRQIDSTIRDVKPGVACFEYDYPDNHGLAALTRTRRAHPALPILVVSTHYSDALAVCALRARAWRYVVKPYPIADTLYAMIVLSRAAADRAINQSR